MLIEISPQDKNPTIHSAAENLDLNLINDSNIALLAYIYPDGDFKEQAKVLNDLARVMRKVVQIFLLDDEDVPLYQEFEINGSPTFIFLYNGEERGRMLGKADLNTLTDFISGQLLNMI
jgi:hypothetical protein